MNLCKICQKFETCKNIMKDPNDMYQNCKSFVSIGNQSQEREWSIAEVIEALRQWEDQFYSETETKWLMDKAADYLESLLVIVYVG